MNSVVWLLMAACIAGIHAAPSLPPLPVNPGGIGGLFRGPNQETIIRGPDGSEITSEHLGGAVQTEARLEPIVVPDQIEVTSGTISPEVISVSNNIGLPSATQVVTISENAVPSLQVSPPQQVPIDVPISTVQVLAAPTIVASSQEPHIIETELVDAPEVEPNQSSDLKGPSGSISVRGSTSIVSGPASTTISEPVRRIPVGVIPVASPPVAVPSTILIPPAPTAADGFQLNVAQTSVNQASTSLPSNQVSLAYNDQQISPYLHTELVPPPPPPPLPPNGQIPLNGITYTGASSPSTQTQTISSTAIPPDSLPPNAIDLGQTVVSTTQRSTVVPSNSDIDVRRINLGQTNAEQTSSLSTGGSGLLSSTISPLDGRNIISSTSAPILSSTSQISHQNVGVSLQPNGPLLTTASGSTLSPSDPILNRNSLTGGITSQDQGILTNQISLNNNVNWISSTGVPLVEGNTNVPSRALVKIEQDHILPSTVAPPLSGGPISTVLDTVLVQPTDPRNREVIEFNGKQLENVGNIVPVIHHPVLVAGGLTHLQQIPTASISQLTARHNLENNSSYGR